MEEWKDIKGYEGLYQVSNYGRVRSLAKSWKAGLPCLRTKPETIMAQCLNAKGYPHLALSKDNKSKTHRVHHLVWDTFGNEPRNGMIRQVDHIDNNKTNNNINNLRLVSNRENSTKRSLSLKKTSRFVGVRVNSRKKNSWLAQISINGRATYLGTFENETLAGLAYQKALISLGGL
jgi:hypothetical protein